MLFTVRPFSIGTLSPGADRGCGQSSGPSVSPMPPYRCHRLQTWRCYQFNSYHVAFISEHALPFNSGQFGLHAFAKVERTCREQCAGQPRIALRRQSTTSSSELCEKSEYHMPIACNCRGVLNAINSSAASDSPRTQSKGATGTARTTRAAP